MPTVIAADEALSSCSQNAAYSPIIVAAQIRSAKAQAESGNPAILTVRLWVKLAVLYSMESTGGAEERGLKCLIEVTSNFGHTLVTELSEQGRGLVVFEYPSAIVVFIEDD